MDKHTHKHMHEYINETVHACIYKDTYIYICICSIYTHIYLIYCFYTRSPTLPSYDLLVHFSLETSNTSVQGQKGTQVACWSCLGSSSWVQSFVIQTFPNRTKKDLVSLYLLLLRLFLAFPLQIVVCEKFQNMRWAKKLFCGKPLSPHFLHLEYLGSRHLVIGWKRGCGSGGRMLGVRVGRGLGGWGWGGGGGGGVII